MRNNSKKALQAAFREATFDPRKPGPLSTIVEANDVEYLTSRTIEILKDSKSFEGAVRRAKLRDAAAIIAYAMTLCDGA